jgi:hypothetical protein
MDNSVRFATGEFYEILSREPRFGKSGKNIGNFTWISRYVSLFPSGDMNSP